MKNVDIQKFNRNVFSVRENENIGSENTLEKITEIKPNLTLLFLLSNLFVHVRSLPYMLSYFWILFSAPAKDRGKSTSGLVSRKTRR